MSAAKAFKDEKEQLETDSLQPQWLEENRVKMQNLARDLGEIVERLDNLGEEIEARIESEL